jgi:hypothetical protein
MDNGQWTMATMTLGFFYSEGGCQVYKINLIEKLQKHLYLFTTIKEFQHKNKRL